MRWSRSGGTRSAAGTSSAPMARSTWASKCQMRRSGQLSAGDHTGMAVGKQRNSAGLAVEVGGERLGVDGAEVVHLEEGLHHHLPVAGQGEAAAVHDPERLAVVLGADLAGHRTEEVEQRYGVGVL